MAHPRRTHHVTGHAAARWRPSPCGAILPRRLPRVRRRTSNHRRGLESPSSSPRQRSPDTGENRLGGATRPANSDRLSTPTTHTPLAARRRELHAAAAFVALQRSRAKHNASRTVAARAVRAQLNDWRSPRQPRTGHGWSRRRKPPRTPVPRATEQTDTILRIRPRPCSARREGTNHIRSLRQLVHDTGRSGRERRKRSVVARRRRRCSRRVGSTGSVRPGEAGATNPSPSLHTQWSHVT